MTGVTLVAILAFGAGAIEGLIRGGGIACVAEAALAGFVWGTIAAGLLALAAGLRWLLPAELRTWAWWGGGWGGGGGPAGGGGGGGWRGGGGGRGGWGGGGALAVVVCVAAEFVVARGLALRFRDPTLVALVAGVAGVVLAWVCALVVVPLAARGVALAERWGLRRVRGLRGVGLAVMLGGAAALVGGSGQARSERPCSEVVAWTIALADRITDIDGDGDGLLLPPRGA